MKKTRKTLSSILAITCTIAMLFINIKNVQAIEYEGKNVETNTGETIKKTNVQVNLSDKLKNQLNGLGINFENIKSSNLVHDNFYNKDKYVIDFDNQTIELNTDFQLENISNNNPVNVSNNSRRVRRSLTITNKINNRTDALVVIQKVKDLLNIKEDYKLVENDAFDDNMWILLFERQLKDNLINPYEAIKIFINRNDSSIQNFRIFNEKPNTLDSKISSKKAIEISKDIIAKYGSTEKINTSIEIFKPNHYWTEGLGKISESVRVAWLVTDGTIKVYIDAVTGEILGGDEDKGSDHAKAFGHDSVNYSYNSAKLAESGFKKLGYVTESTFTTSTSNMRGAVLDFLKKSTSYGFYITCHTRNSGAELCGGGGWSVDPSDIHGNFHLVFLDACSTAADRRWCNAFNCDRPQRGLLGWRYSVGFDPAYKFCQYFWPRVGNKPIYNLALDAAASVPGKGTTPIIHYGDKSWRGWAH